MTSLPASPTPATGPVLPLRQDWSAQFRRFADEDCPEDPLYQALCRQLAARPALLALMDEAPPEQARPNLYLAALQARVMAFPQSALAAYFPSVGGRRPPDEGLVDSLTGFVGEHEAALRALLRHRATQTNEIGRCALLWPALQHMARAGGRRRLALFDFGCSAGLNLGVDAYRYRYLAPDGRAVDAGAAADPSVPLISCRWQGVLPRAEAGFELALRQGVDLSPLQAAEPDDARWLLACLWPHDQERRERLQSALALARQRAWPVEAAQDGLARLASWLDGLPPDVQPVLFHSWVLYYFQAADRLRHAQRVERLMAQRGLWWLSAESLADSDWPAGAALAPRPEGVSAGSATLWQWRRAGQAPQALAWSHPHGRFAHWLAPAAGAPGPR